MLRESVRHATTSNHRVAVRIGDKISQKAGYSYKKGMLRNMLTSLIEHERIKTTVARAKKLVRLSDKMVTLGKRGDLGAHRLAAKQLRTKYTLTKLFTSKRDAHTAAAAAAAALGPLVSVSALSPHSRLAADHFPCRSFSLSRSLRRALSGAPRRLYTRPQDVQPLGRQRADGLCGDGRPSAAAHATAAARGAWVGDARTRRALLPCGQEGHER